MPWTDWQFWIVTAAFLWGVRVVVRQIVPAADQGPGCGNCAVGAARATSDAPEAPGAMKTRR